MKHILSLCLLAFATMQVGVAQPIPVKLWNDRQPPHASTITTTETTDDWGFVRNVSEAEMYIYKANPTKNTGKAVILCPGGGYGGVSMQWEGTEFAKWLAENGVTASVLKYRLPNGVHQIPLEDAQRALELMRQHAAEWGGYKTDKIGVAGFSAGGHLAATLSVRSNPAFSILFYPVISSGGACGHPGSFQALTGGNTELNEYYSAENFVTTSTPPALIIHCADDDVVPLASSELYRKALIDKGVFVESVVYPKGGHGFGMNDRFPEREHMKATMLSWILKQK